MDESWNFYRNLDIPTSRQSCGNQLSLNILFQIYGPVFSFKKMSLWVSSITLISSSVEGQMDDHLKLNSLSVSCVASPFIHFTIKLWHNCPPKLVFSCGKMGHWFQLFRQQPILRLEMTVTARFEQINLASWHYICDWVGKSASADFWMCPAQSFENKTLLQYVFDCYVIDSMLSQCCNDAKEKTAKA